MTESYVLERYKGGCLYAFIGAGGKTSTIKRVASVLAKAGYRVMISTTTRFSVKEWSGWDVQVLSDSIKEEPEMWDIPQGRIRVVVHGETEGKYLGFGKSVLDELSIPLDMVFLVEADGSRRKPFKLPLAHEPVIPDRAVWTDLIISTNIIGKPITSENTYNLKEVEGIIGAGRTYDPMTVFNLLTMGWMDGLERVRIIFNGPLDLRNRKDSQLLMGKKILTMLHEERGLECSLVDSLSGLLEFQRGYRVSAVVLAAGCGTRMNGIKPLKPLGDSTFLEATLKKTFAVAKDVVVTVGCHEDDIRSAIPERGFRYVTVEHYQEGMGESLHQGAKVLREPMDAFLVLPCDLPLLEENILRLVVDAGRLNPNKIIVPRYGGRNGHPVLFPSGDLYLMESLHGDAGARGLLKDQGVLYLDLDDPGIVADVDSEEDYEKIRRIGQW